MISWMPMYNNANSHSDALFAAVVFSADLPLSDVFVALLAEVEWWEEAAPVLAALDAWLLELCELTADVSRGVSEFSTGQEDWMELGAGIEVAGSIDEDTGISDTAGAKTFVSPSAEAAEPV